MNSWALRALKDALASVRLTPRDTDSCVRNGPVAAVARLPDSSGEEEGGGRPRPSVRTSITAARPAAIRPASTSPPAAAGVAAPAAGVVYVRQDLAREVAVAARDHKAQFLSMHTDTAPPAESDGRGVRGWCMGGLPAASSAAPAVPGGGRPLTIPGTGILSVANTEAVASAQVPLVL